MTHNIILPQKTLNNVFLFGLLVRLCLPPPLLVKFVLMCHVCFLLCDDYLQTFKLQLCRRQFVSLYGHYIMTKTKGSNIRKHDMP
jgi:hypothetical protein